ncbi:MAG: C1 family peptidase [Paludibacteraceae bacterium]|nr:C1 family peptidase [Paludibacteraceae bacterium]
MKIGNFIKKTGCKLGIAAVMASPLALHTSCDEDTAALIFDIIDQLVGMMGYDPNQEDVADENTDDDFTNDDTQKLPSSRSWVSYAPPIGNQGQYGTCVAWATGYGLKTTLNRIDGKISSASSAANQTSPIALWHLMYNNTNGGASRNCGGSSFDPAFKVMMSYGVETMDKKPFTNQKMDCNASASGMGNLNNKLGDYRLVAYTSELSGKSAYGMSARNIKYHLNQGPLVVGAKLGERFMRWNNSNKITVDDPESYNGGQHAYHAMMVVGYDDSKGAFRLQNSWGASDWGDNGYIWVDYDFFVKNFAFGVWSASNDPNHYSGGIGSTLRAGSGNDLALTVKSDKQNADGTRTLKFDIKNVGSQSVDLEECNVALVLYRKKHFHEKAVLSKETAAGVLNSGEEKSFSITYSIPAVDNDGYAVSGDYYMYLSLDAKDEIKDEDLTSNFAFITGADSKPFEILDGEIGGQTYALHEDLSGKILGDYHGVELFHRLAKELGK